VQTDKAMGIRMSISAIMGKHRAPFFDRFRLVAF
jgi:hypothetical protein